MTSHRRKTEVINYFLGRCSREDQEKLENWLRQDPGNVELAEVIIQEAIRNHALWSALEQDKSLVRQKVMAGIGKKQNIPGGGARNRLLGKIAAIIVSMGLLSSIWYHYADQWITLQTNYGEVKTFVLPDESKVRLNANTQLRYRSDWQDGLRELWLEGEGFFTVKHTLTNQGFLVHVPSGASIEVVGTEFNVFSRRNILQTVLKSGKIAFKAAGKIQSAPITLKPGSVVEQINQEKINIQFNADPEKYYAWTQGKWILDDESLGDILRKIRDSYGLQVQLTNPALALRSAYGSIPLPHQGQSPETLLENVADLYDLTIIRNKGHYYLKG
ncbi:FecR family protein [Siphonobacter curvatus]|uniref:FecR protein domain-containing protein n=1 Tax=Siphonobacter curvatus TaxID=2094562 RepID=A0A2S7IJV7_9BACT|nr:FecR domain-containing protein [Siphonobacter curvatus]PQA56979.1 hypothetical protein C5O19_16740 [Siphonobacter curvatus]